MTQEPLFCEDIYEAIRVAVMALGGPKKVGTMLWPEKSPENARDALNNALNRTRNERLDPEQVGLIRREASKIGCHTIAHFENTDAHYAPPIPVTPEDERAQANLAVIEAAKTLKRAVAVLERL